MLKFYRKELLPTFINIATTLNAFLRLYYLRGALFFWGGGFESFYGLLQTIPTGNRRAGCIPIWLASCVVSSGGIRHCTKKYNPIVEATQRTKSVEIFLSLPHSLSRPYRPHSLPHRHTSTTTVYTDSVPYTGIGPPGTHHHLTPVHNNNNKEKL